MPELAHKLTRYRSIKEVNAAEITAVRPGGCYIRDADGNSIFRLYPPHMTARYTPVPGDFWIVYDSDGYQAISPRAVFLAGYTAIVS